MPKLVIVNVTWNKDNEINFCCINWFLSFNDEKASGRLLINVSKDDLELELVDEEYDETKLEQSQMTTLCERIKLLLGDKVDQVKVSSKIDSQFFFLI